jgi:hypothetical protein
VTEPAQTATLAGAWTHSFEEDEGDVQVYRPAHAFPFPVSRRGRESLEFLANGELRASAPGPDDRYQTGVKTVTQLGTNRYRLAAAIGAATQVVEVVEQTPQLLKLRFAPSAS